MKALKEQLVREYESRINRYHLLWPLKKLGFIQFYIKDGKIVSKDKWTLLIVIIFLIIWDVSAFFIYRQATVSQSALLSTEGLIILITILMQNSALIRNLLLDESFGRLLCNCLIDIDVSLGVAETKFMRDISAQGYVVLCILSGMVQGVMITFYCTLWATDWTIKLTSILFFGFNLIYYDFCFCIMIAVFLTLRVRCINVALIKLAKLNPTYFPKHLYFDGLIWKDKFDNLMNFHNRAESKDYVNTFKTFFVLLRCAEKMYRFFILTGIVAVILLTFSVIQTLTDYLISPTSQYRTIFATFWVFGSWIISIFGYLELDVMYDEIERCKLICIYILLKASIPAETIHIADSILKTLSTRSYFISIYGMFDLKAGMFLNLAAALIVFVTMQLQILLENVNTNTLTYNITTT